MMKAVGFTDGSQPRSRIVIAPAAAAQRQTMATAYQMLGISALG